VTTIIPQLATIEYLWQLCLWQALLCVACPGLCLQGLLQRCLCSIRKHQQIA
jgi:hypothetical protein